MFGPQRHCWWQSQPVTAKYSKLWYQYWFNQKPFNSYHPSHDIILCKNLLFSVKSNNNKISTKVFSSIRYNWNKKEGDNKPDKEGKVRKLCRKKSRSWKSWFEGRESAEESYALLTTDKEKSAAAENVNRHANNIGKVVYKYRAFHTKARHF